MGGLRLSRLGPAELEAGLSSRGGLIGSRVSDTAGAMLAHISFSTISKLGVKTVVAVVLIGEPEPFSLFSSVRALVTFAGLEIGLLIFGDLGVGMAVLILRLLGDTQSNGLGSVDLATVG